MVNLQNILCFFDIHSSHFSKLVILVHGFVNATSYVVEGGTLDTLFQLNVKGMTAFSGLNFEGTITAAAGGSASKSGQP